MATLKVRFKEASAKWPTRPTAIGAPDFGSAPAAASDGARGWLVPAVPQLFI